MSVDENENIFSPLCRLCLSENVELIGLYPHGKFDPKSSSNISFEIIERFTTVIISPLDKLPQKICSSCVEMLQTMLSIQNQCRENDVLLRKMAATVEDNGDPNESNSRVDSEHRKVQPSNLDESEIVDELDTHDDSADYASKETESLRKLATVEDSEVNAMLEANIDDSELKSHDQKENIDNYVKHDSNNAKKGGNSKSWRARVIACDICGKLYCKYEMQYHMNKHNNLKPFKCGIDNCTSAFPNPGDLHTHKKALHGPNPRFKCDICGKEFNWRYGLKLHRLQHFEPEIPCQICGQLFQTNPALRKHMSVHNQDQKRKFECDTCGKAFQHKYMLRNHMRTHTKEKPYVCHCGESFAQKGLLTAHNKKVH